ncbi:hypothetical protein [Nonomuraea sp. NPDC049758]|uniref:hypothetical protein n=1 Tax=Nonomuraea sp. NPDC049758 TaxID=3154360 RepID=UPI003425455A
MTRRRRVPWRAGVAVLVAVLAAGWVAAPLPAEPGVRFVGSQPVTPGRTAKEPAKPAKRTKYATPIRYAYAPSCDACAHMILVGDGAERGRLPYSFDGTMFALSRDGRRAAFLRDSDNTYVVADLRTGAVERLPVRQPRGTVTALFGAQPPLFSLDGRHVLLQPDHLTKDTDVVLEPPVIVDVARGTATRLPDRGQVAGWTSEGLVMKSGEPTRRSPGHLRSVRFAVYSPKGDLLRGYTMPGNVEWAIEPSPSGRLIASRHRELTPGGVLQQGVALFDTKTGEHVRTVTPRLATGWWLAALLRWEDEDTLTVRANGPLGETAYLVLDLRTAAIRPIDVTGEVADFMLQPAELSVVLGRVRQ